LGALQAQIEEMGLSAPDDSDAEAGPQEEITALEEGETQADKVILLNVYCEICQKDLPIAFSRAQAKPVPDAELAEFTYMHAFNEEGLDPHGLRISIDSQDTLAKVEYVDVAGSRISPVQEQELEQIPSAAGPWTPSEQQTLMLEVKNGMPKRSLARLFQRPLAEIESKLQEIERDKLTHFNKIIAESTLEAKGLEETDPAAAKRLWVKLAEYCLEFAKSPELAVSVAAMIRKKTAGILARAKKL
jgi:hypothetical protein